jgi:hypothetical protein
MTLRRGSGIIIDHIKLEILLGRLVHVSTSTLLKTAATSTLLSAHVVHNGAIILG